MNNDSLSDYRLDFDEAPTSHGGSFPLQNRRSFFRSCYKSLMLHGVTLIAVATVVFVLPRAMPGDITTTGSGVIDTAVQISGDRARPGDKILLSGAIGDHGMAIMSQRENLEFEGTIESDTAALHTLVAAMVNASVEIHCLRDPTRGGVATTLNEIATSSGVGMVIDERQIPVRKAVKGGCEIFRVGSLLRSQRE